LVDPLVLILTKKNPNRMCKKLSIEREDVGPFCKNKIREVIEEKVNNIID
jgi:hypothetical protein